MGHKVVGFGCPRSGTKYTVKVLRELLGLDVGHERLSKDGGIGWGFARWPGVADCGVAIHLVRDPLLVISSIYVNHTLKKPGVFRFCVRAARADQWFDAYRKRSDYPRRSLDTVAAFYVAWERMCTRALARARDGITALVDDPWWVMEVADELGTKKPSTEQVREMMGRRINHRRDHCLTLDDLKDQCSSEVYEQVCERI